MTLDPEWVLEAWTDAIRAAYSLAKAERARELRGDRSVRRFDQRSLHPYSEEWGRVLALEAMLPGLALLRDTGAPSCDPISLRKQAYSEADAAYRERLLAGLSDP